MAKRLQWWWQWPWGLGAANVLMMSAPTEKMVPQSIISSEIFIVTHPIVFLPHHWMSLIFGRLWELWQSIDLSETFITHIRIMPVIRWSLLNSCHICGWWLSLPNSRFGIGTAKPPSPSYRCVCSVAGDYLYPTVSKIWNWQDKPPPRLCQVSLICGWWLHQKETKWCRWVAKSTAHPLTKPNNSSSLWKTAWNFSSFLVKGIVFFDNLMICELFGKKVKSVDLSKTLWHWQRAKIVLHATNSKDLAALKNKKNILVKTEARRVLMVLRYML